MESLPKLGYKLYPLFETHKFSGKFIPRGIGVADINHESTARCFPSYAQFVWNDHDMGREFVIHNTPAPEFNCMCGFHAWSEYPGLWPESVSPDKFVFQVELYGKVIVHEKGYRAEKQRLIALKRPVCKLHQVKEHVLISEYDGRIYSFSKCDPNFTINPAWYENQVQPGFLEALALDLKVDLVDHF